MSRLEVYLGGGGDVSRGDQMIVGGNVGAVTPATLEEAGIIREERALEMLTSRFTGVSEDCMCNEIRLLLCGNGELKREVKGMVTNWYS